MKVAFIGLGIMGSRMARNLLKGGHDLSVFNRTAGKSNALEQQGARVAATAADAVRGADVVFTMLANPDAVSRVARGEAGFLDAMSLGSLWVDSSTVNPSFSREMAAEASRRHLHFVDAPVAGSLPVAEKGELVFLVGAEAQDFARCEPLLRLMGKTIRHVGGVGMGTSMKMVVNMLLGTSMAAFSEALALGRALGFSQAALLDVLVGGATTAPFIAAKRARIESGSFAPEFPLRLMYKDLQLAASTAFEHGVPLPTTNAVKEVFAMAFAAGLADEDFSAVVELFREKT